MHPGRCDSQTAAIRHCIAGIVVKIQHNLLQLPKIPHENQVLVNQLKFDTDVFARKTTEHLFHVKDQVVEMNRLGCHDLFAAEGQQAVRQRSSLLGSIDNALHSGKMGRIRTQTHFKDTCIAQYAGQDIVEFVGHPAGQLADGIELLGMMQLFLELLFLKLCFLEIGNIANRFDGADLITVMVVQRRCRYPELPFSKVIDCRKMYLCSNRLPPPFEILVIEQQHFFFRSDKINQDRAPHSVKGHAVSIISRAKNILLCHPGHFLESLIPCDDTMISVNNERSIRQKINDSLQALVH